MEETELIKNIYITQILLEKGANKLFYKKFNLTERAFIPLRMIYGGADTISEMKKYSAESSASLTQKMNNLEKLGLVKRELDMNDKRKWRFKITAKGGRTLKVIRAKEQKAIKFLFTDFSEKEKLLFGKSLKKLQQKLRPAPLFNKPLAK